MRSMAVDPLGDLGVVTGRRHVIEGDVAGEEDPVLRQVHHQIPERMRGVVGNHLDDQCRRTGTSPGR